MEKLSSLDENVENIEESKEMELDRKVGQLAELIKQAKHANAFTGSGVGSANPSIIPARKQMAFVELLNKKYFKTLVSSNNDGLHLRSGIHQKKLYEINGNKYLEVCKKCNKKYLRDFIVSFKPNRGQKVYDHKTGRKCDNLKCGGALHDQIINQGENIERMTMGWSVFSAMESDLFVSFGSSLKSTLEKSIVTSNKVTKGKFVIINPQKVQVLEQYADLVIHAQAGEVIEILMKKLNLEIPQFKLKKQIKLSLKTDEKTKDETFDVCGIDSDWNPDNSLNQTKINDQICSKQILNNEYEDIMIELQFSGNYNLKPLTFMISKTFIKKYSKRYEDTIIINFTHDLTEWDQPYACRFSKWDCKPIDDQLIQYREQPTEQSESDEPSDPNKFTFCSYVEDEFTMRKQKLQSK